MLIDLMKKFQDVSTLEQNTIKRYKHIIRARNTQKEKYPYHQTVAAKKLEYLEQFFDNNDCKLNIDFDL